MVVRLGLDAGQLVDDYLLEISVGQEARVGHLELFQLEWGLSFLAVVLVVSDEEGTTDLPELALQFLHDL